MHPCCTVYRSKFALFSGWENVCVLDKEERNMSRTARKRMTMDGNTACAHVAYALSEVAAIYPITPSSPMADCVDQWSAHGRKNVFGSTVRVCEMQSEGGAAGALHGSLSAGALSTTFTASQGLLLMIPNMYKIAAERMPSVFHVSARTIATHALNIFGDHSDVMACRQTGFALLAEGNVQEVMDLSAVAHLAAISARSPFLNFFDGFRTSHELQKIDVWDYADLAEMVDTEALDEFRARALNPEHPLTSGSHENGDVFFQHREACNQQYSAIPGIVQHYMNAVNERLGTDYGLFNYYGHPEATRVIVAMGSFCNVIEEVVDYLNAQGQRVGLVKVRLYRPFSVEHFVDVLPPSVERIAVMDRTKEPGSAGEPLYQDVVTALFESKRFVKHVIGGRYGLGSKDTPPSSAFAIFEELNQDHPRREFTVGIVDDVTHLSLPEKPSPNTAAKNTFECKFWGLGGDGTVGANKNSIKIIGDNTSKYVQAYFQYDSKKTGGITISHLRCSDTPIKSSYYVNKADFIACHNPSYIAKGLRIVQDLKPGGIFLINARYTPQELKENLDVYSKRYIVEHHIHVYLINAIDIAERLGMGKRTNTILQAAFFALSGIMPLDDAVRYMKQAAEKSYAKKGADVVQKNFAAIDAGLSAARAVAIDSSWYQASCAPEGEAMRKLSATERMVRDLTIPIGRMEGDFLPVSAFMDFADGKFNVGASQYEKRGVAAFVPHWDTSKCIQCNSCAYACPHACVRPFALNDAEKENAPLDLELLPIKSGKGKGVYDYTLAISPLDCMGCGVCVDVCPTQALTMVPTEQEMAGQHEYDYCVQHVSQKDELVGVSVKDSQFSKPLLEYSGACAGCAQTSYARLITQLFGDKMFIANSTGCSSIWGNPAATTPFTVDENNRGPAWSNSLFEDNAEYGYGMKLGHDAVRARVIDAVHTLTTCEDAPEHVRELAQEFYDARDDESLGTTRARALIDVLEKSVSNCAEQTNTETQAEHTSVPDAGAQQEDALPHQDTTVQAVAQTHPDQAAQQRVETLSCTAVRSFNDVRHYILENKSFITKKSVWIFGGDGWAYDIGFGGLDHVLAQGEDINVFVFDTEVYSNTGGQSSKASNIGQVAQFAAAGKDIKKKSLAEIFMSYGYIYVAQVAMGAKPAQTIKAITEAEQYKGPSLIIAYSPCEMHAIKGGMSMCHAEMKRAVECGYWNLFRFNPSAPAGKKFTLDCKAPGDGYKDFLMNEARYSRLTREFPDRAEELFDSSEQAARERWEHLERLKVLYSQM